MANVCPKIKLNDGNELPVLGLGTWMVGPGEVYDAVCHAIDIGYRHLDCALAYENEDGIGRAIADKIKQGVLSRDDLFVTSKNWNTYRSSEEKVLEGFQKTMTDLKLKYLDLYLIHWPFSWKEDGEIFPKDDKGGFYTTDADFMIAWKAMEKLQKAGKVRSIGVSNFNSEQISRVLAEGSVKPVTNQVESHTYLQQEKLRAFCAEHNIVITAYSPLGSPYKPFALDGPIPIKHPALIDIGKTHGKSPAQVMLRFQLQRGIVVIPKSTNYERMRENFQLFDFELTQSEMNTIKKLDKAYRFVSMDAMKCHKYFPFGIEF
ncbi:1,5-anhydro-D-fructose reductase-like isoform X1 [Varroa destructor]|uniref:NADP-dependent oxidoreductase domain-containing protein n=1 Tax=Varroa destructor TaxID=109461 RepID=A0A7M7MJV1_VARDE|nr:1,5-anhydro-D-fructose reductase-like isoform X1 [Varroa destructor]